MKHIYMNQTALRLSLDTGIDLQEGDSGEIRYRKPDGSTGFFPAFINEYKEGVIFHDFTDSEELDQWGWWRFWAYVTFSDGRTASGKSVNVFVYQEGS